MLFYVAAFILLLGPLVFIHELGHFLFAKLFNVRVDTFSMGFGPKIFKKTWGETEYCLSIIPLGGYVKLFGQDPSEVVEPENKHRALSSQDAWKRFLIFVGGPLFNFLFSIFIFAVMLIYGEPHFSPVIERVVAHSQAYKAGFRSGDTILAVDRTVVTKFDEVAKAIADSPNKELEFRIKREGAVREIKVTPHPEPGLSVYGESIEVGDINGLFNTGRHPVIGISDPRTLAAKAGLKTGDEIVTFNEIKVKNFEHLEVLVDEALKASKKEFVIGYVPHEISYWQPENKQDLASQAANEVKLPARSLVDLGIHSSELFIVTVIKDSPAEAAGLKSGDLLVSVEGEPLRAFVNLREHVQQFGESKGSIDLAFERQGKRILKTLTPKVTEMHDPAGNEHKQYMIGLYPLFIQSAPDMFFEKIYNPFTLTIEAWSRALDLSGKTLISIKKLFFRQVSVGTLGGPLLIGKLAGDSMERGFAQFLKVMALISISLAIFNILPVPILDGGHIFLLFLEVIRGKPMTLKQNEVVQQIGLTLIVFLLVVVLFNDISRVGIPALKTLFQ